MMIKMKKLVQSALVLTFIALILFPQILLADSISPSPATAFTATFADNKLTVSFKECSDNDMDGYLVLRKSGVGYTMPNVQNKIGYSVGNTLIVDTPWEQWEVLSNNSIRGNVLEFGNGSYTYLIYMRDTSKNYSTPSRIVVNNSSPWTEQNLSVDMLVLTGGEFNLNAGHRLNLLNNGSIAWFAGSITNSGIIEITSPVTVPATSTFNNANGSVTVKNGGALYVAGSFNSQYSAASLNINSGGLVKVLPGASLLLDQGMAQVNAGGTVQIEGLMEMLPNSNGFSNQGGSLIFTSGARFNQHKNVAIPAATWLNGATCAYYGDYWQGNAPSGLNQDFYNFIWNMGTTQGNDMNLLCALKVRGTLRVESTNGNKLILGNCSNYTIGSIEVANGARIEVPANTTFTNDLILNEGELTVNGVFNLEGGLTINNSASIKSSTGKTIINFTNVSGKGNKSVLKLPTGLSQEKALWSINVNNGRTITLGSDIELGGNAPAPNNCYITVQKGGSLLLADKVVRKAAGALYTTFTVMIGATLGTGHAQGISAQDANTGAVLTDARVFNSAAYIYNGTVAQVTGSGLPAVISQLIVNTANVVSLRQDVTVNNVIHLQQGTLNIAGKTLAVKGDLVIGNGNLLGSNTSNISISNKGVHSVLLPAVELKNLTISSEAGVSLAGDVKIYGKVDMQYGVLNTQNHTFILDAAALLYEPVTETSYVLGSISTVQEATNINQDYTFGNIGLTLNFKGTAAGTTTVTRMTGDMSENAKGKPVISRAFKIDTQVKSGLNASMMIRYMKLELKGLLEDELVFLRSVDGGESIADWGMTKLDKASQSITLNAIDSFSPATRITASSAGASMRTASTNSFKAYSVQALSSDPGTTVYVGRPSEPVSALPVELVSFSVTADANGAARLSWNTAAEINNDKFDIERSEGGKNWRNIGEVKGAGTISAARSYTFTDASFKSAYTSEVVYYRLKQIDLDGAFALSKVVSLQPVAAGSAISQVYYNAAASAVEIDYQNMSKGAMQLVLADANGHIILNHNYTLDSTTGRLTIPVQPLANGLYVVKAAAGHIYFSGKFVQQEYR